MASPMTLKLLINSKAQKVVFAEAEKPFVDFLLYLMALPLGTVTKLVEEKAMVGALGNLYGSIADLGDTYMQPGINKNTFLNPKVSIVMSSSDNVPLLMPAASPALTSESRKVYICSNYRKDNNYNGGSFYGSPVGYSTSSSCTSVCYSDDPTAKCVNCKGTMTVSARYVAPPVKPQVPTTGGEGSGFVRGVVSYMVMDDLKVIPQSTISAITTLTDSNVKDFESLEVKVVPLDNNVGLKLLKAALETTSVLTTVFLGKSS